jgi:hypothetical protein
MPQASDKDRRKAERLFGSIDSGDACAFLKRKGWRLETPRYEWRKPFAAYEVSDDEWFAIDFLIDEWDFGGVSYGPYYAGCHRHVDAHGIPTRVALWWGWADEEARSMLFAGRGTHNPWEAARKATMGSWVTAANRWLVQLVNEDGARRYARSTES